MSDRVPMTAYLIEYPSPGSPPAEWDEFEAELRSRPQDDPEVKAAMAFLAECRPAECRPNVLQFPKRPTRKD